MILQGFASRRSLWLAVTGAIAGAAAPGSAQQIPADLIIRGGTLYPGDTAGERRNHPDRG